MPSSFYSQGKSPCHPLDRRLGGPQSWSGHSSEEKNSQTLLGFEPLIIQPSPVLYQLQEKGRCITNIGYILVIQELLLYDCNI
jgi:hypothetical protein